MSDRIWTKTMIGNYSALIGYQSNSIKPFLRSIKYLENIYNYKFSWWEKIRIYIRLRLKRMGYILIKRHRYL